MRVNRIQGPLLLTVIELVVLPEVSRRVVDVMVGLSGAGDRSFTRYCRGRISRDRCARANRGRDRAGRRRGYRRSGAHRGGRVLHPRRVHLARHPRPLYACISPLSKTRDSREPPTLLSPEGLVRTALATIHRAGIIRFESSVRFRITVYRLRGSAARQPPRAGMQNYLVRGRGMRDRVPCDRDTYLALRALHLFPRGWVDKTER